MDPEDPVAYRCHPEVSCLASFVGVRRELKQCSYRVNVFGFPNAAALSHQNPGLLDQRKA
jgi:hypothetical protein